MAKSINRKVTIYVNGREVENTLKGLRAELKRLENQQKNATIGSEEYIATTQKINQLKQYLKDHELKLKDLDKGWKDTAESLAKYSNILMGLQSASQMVDLGVGKLKDLAVQAAEMDDIYSDVQKTTGLTREEVARLNEEFKKMDTRTSREQLNQLAYEAGKLGISSLNAVLQFVRASDKINIALGDVLGDGAMVAIGKMADVYTQSTDELKAAGDDLEKKMLAIGSAVNQLGQESTANEHYLVDFTARMGGIAVQANMSAGQVLGFASALDQSMQKVEMSATAFQKFIGQVMKQPEEFAKQANMSVSEFSKLIRTDLNEALLRVLEGFKGQGGYAELVNIFKDLGLDGARAATVISSMANNIEKITDAQWIANEQLRERNSIEDEFDKKNTNRQAEREKAMKAYNDMCEELGNTLYPILIRLTKTGTSILKVVSAIVNAVKEEPLFIAALTASLLALFRTRIVLAAATLKEKIAIEGNWFARNKEERASRRVSLQLAKEQVERLKALKVRLQERVAINNSVLARKQELIATGRQNVIFAAEARAKGLNIALTKTQNMLIDAQKAKTLALSGVMKSTPWGLIISAVTAVIGLLINHNAKLKEAKERERELAQEEARVGENASRAKVEIERYTQRIKERIEKGGDEKLLVEQLNSKYGEIFGTYKTLAEWYDVLTSKVEDYVQALFLEAKAKKNIDNAAEMDAQIEAYKKMKAEAMEEVDTPGWFKRNMARLDALFVAGNDKNKTYRAEMNKWWDSQHRQAEEQKRAIIQNMEEQRDAYIKASEDMLKESARLQSVGGFKIVQGDMVNEEEFTSGGSGSGESAKERAKRLKKAAKEWETVKNQAEKLVINAEIKSENGLSKVADEVAAKFDQMRQSIANAAVEAGKMKLDDDGNIVSMTDEVAALISEMYEAEQKLKQAKIEEYIKKQTAALEKMKRSLKGEKSDNEYLNKMEEAARNLQTALAQIDEAILKAEADSANATGEEKQRLDGLIAAYRQLKAEMQATVYSRIDTSVQAKPVGSGESKFSSETQAKVDEKQKSGLGMLFDKSAFTAYGKAIESIGEKYTAQAKKIGEARAAEDAIIARLQAKRMLESDPANQLLLDAEIAKHKEKAATLDEEKAKLDEFKQKAEEVAEEDAFGNALDRWIAGIEQFGQQALQLWGSINTLLNNSTEKERKEAEKQKDDNLKRLNEELEQGIISQEDYEEQKEAIQTEYDEREKELQLEQWRRQKALNIGQATMEGALAVLKALSSAPPPYNAILAGISAALAAVQIAAIASEPEPYARGGYVPKRTVYQAGEAGPEWVASNSLLQDPTAAPIIEQLEQYQRGNRRALADIPMAQVNMPVATRAAQELGRRRSLAESSVAAAVQQVPQQVSVSMTQDGEMLQLWRELATYLKDPKNRQAVISRQTMTDFEKNENFLRNRAKL